MSCLAPCGDHAGPSLLNVLDHNGVKATFFVVGWRLTPKTWGERRHEENVGITCIDAAEQLVRRGHELEDHTYSHRTTRRGAETGRAVGDRRREPRRGSDQGGHRYPAPLPGPPDWIISAGARLDLEQQGYHLLTISHQNPLALRDVNSLDYLWTKKSVEYPKFSGGCSLEAGGTAGEAGSVHAHSRLP